MTIYQLENYAVNCIESRHVNLGWYVSKMDGDYDKWIMWNDGGNIEFKSYMGLSESGETSIIALSSGTKI